jgi:hypothetical protein
MLVLIAFHKIEDFKKVLRKLPKGSFIDDSKNLDGVIYMVDYHYKEYHKELIQSITMEYDIELLTFNESVAYDK